MNIDDNILISYIDNTLSEEEKVHVETWMAASPENKKTLEQMYFTLQLAEKLQVMNTVDTDKAFARFKENTKRQNRKVRLSTWLGFQRIAAVLFIPLLVLAGYLFTRGETDDRLQMVEINTNPGVVSAFDLPDGSKVWLNANSSLKYAANFHAEKRFVELSGEGYFEVAKNPEKPFVVRVNPEYSVEVLGTSFNVSAYAEDETIETTLVTGIVQLKWLSESGTIHSRELSPNEKAAYQKSGKKIEVSNANPEIHTGWKDGELIFRQESMENVLKTLSRHYNVTFDVKNPEVMNALITARFTNEQLFQVMEYLKVASNISYTIQKPQINKDDISQKTIVEIRK